VFLWDRCKGVIIKKNRATVPARVEAVSNTSTVTLRVVGLSFSVKDSSSYTDKGGNVNTRVAHTKVNKYGLTILEDYGFYK
jgi:hypothetical protein